MPLAMWVISASVNGTEPQFSDQASLKMSMIVASSA